MLPPSYIFSNVAYKLLPSQAFTVTSMAFLTLFVNTALTLYRAKLTPAVAAPPSPVYNGHTAHTPFPPPHPAYYPAYGHPAAYMAPPPLASPAPGWGAGWRPGEDQATPTRRRRLEGGVEKVQ